MIEILMQYGKAFLWSDGYRFTGVAVTMWLLVLSLVFGFMLALPMSIARVSQKKSALDAGMVLYLYLPRYTAVCAAAGILFRCIYIKYC